jgi:predicted nucleic acid-binding protein
VTTTLVRPTLVDTSAWIEFLRATGSPSDRSLGAALEAGHSLWTTGLVLQELLQGARTSAQADDLRVLLRGCTPVEPLYPDTYEHAASLYARCRRAGRAVRGTVDCLIGAIALEHDLAVLGTDRDLVTLSEVCGLALAT